MLKKVGVNYSEASLLAVLGHVSEPGLAGWKVSLIIIDVVIPMCLIIVLFFGSHSYV